MFSQVVVKIRFKRLTFQHTRAGEVICFVKFKGVLRPINLYNAI